MLHYRNVTHEYDFRTEFHGLLHITHITRTLSFRSAGSHLVASVIQITSCFLFLPVLQSAIWHHPGRTFLTL
jgi:hypothetical protein